MMTLSSLSAPVLAEGIVLMSWWKPLLLVLTFYPWAWLISRVYDKHAARFHLPRRKWNTFHMLMGMAALVGALAAGLALRNEGAFWVGWGVTLIVLTVDLVCYAVTANRDDRVPEHHHIRFSMETLRAGKKKKEEEKAAASVELLIKTPSKQVVPPPQAETPEFEVRAAAEGVYVRAIAARASQIDIGPTGRDSTYGVVMLIDGVPQAGDTMPAADALRVMDFWKACGQMDVTDRRRRQTADVTAEKDGIKRVVRLTSIGSQGGMRLSMLFDPAQAVLRDVKTLGLLEMQMEELRSIVQDEQGVVLLAAPPDGGRTTTLYSVTKMHDAYISNVQTLEIDPQAGIEGVRANKFDALKEGAEFATTLRSILRRDPDVVAVGDLPDANTAIEAARSDHERTRVYLSMRADDALTAIQGYVKAVGDPKAAAKSLHGVVAQKLVRKLCTNCRIGYPPPADMLKKLGIPEGKVPQLFKKGGQVIVKNKPEICDACQGVGYLGQEGVFEVYVIGPEERDLIASGNFQGLRAALRKRKQPTIQQAAIRKAVEGITSVEEVMRVTATAPAGDTQTKRRGAEPPPTA